MCGICFAIRLIDDDQSQATSTTTEPVSAGATGSVSTALDVEDVWDTCVGAVKPRPDCSHSRIQQAAISSSTSFELRFHTSVLHMRGTEVTPQPFVSEEGDVLLFNGEVFDGLEVSTTENDGQKLFDAIQSAGPDNFLSAIKHVEGPYAFVYYQAKTHKLYFARDPLGRRSLLLHKPSATSPFLLLSSNAPSSTYALSEWEELGAEAVYSYDLGEMLNDTGVIYPFDRLLTTHPDPSDRLASDETGLPILTPAYTTLLHQFHSELSSSILKRVSPVPHTPLDPHARIAVLFSGGIDCSMLALLADQVLKPGETIDLINVAFENPRKLRGDVKEGQKKWVRKGGKNKGKGKSDVAEVEAEAEAEPEPEAAVVPDPPVETEEPSSVSGGSDTPIDSKVYDVPDRLTGRASCEDLRKLRPGRKFNFIEVNVPYAEMLGERQRVIDLMRPNRTIMDLSISIAFFFAARGRGVVLDPNGGEPTPYQSTAKVLLSGLGADELLGGYQRHRRAFNKPPGEDWTSLIAELQMDLDRISFRNLGRDDRIISYHGKEARYPFLAANVVDFCARLPVAQKCDMGFAEGVGDKLLLRMLARSLGMDGAAGLKKRAIHFVFPPLHLHVPTQQPTVDTMRFTTVIASLALLTPAFAVVLPTTEQIKLSLDSIFTSDDDDACPDLKVRCLKDGDITKSVGDIGKQSFCKVGLQCEQCHKSTNTAKCNAKFLKDCAGKCEAQGSPV
ncbi:asparagine synthase (glutamine-hydrolyzing) [Pseudohyphozyma bogoriensis]|nr:asparagine synthase (glutamine-hydrolyzing) [Pseudohyphozyma bogoriensis]